MAFSEKQWIEKAHEKLGQIAFWLDQRRGNDMLYLAYSTISGLALWPLFEEAAGSGDMWPVIGPMYGVTTGAGADLIAKELQRLQGRSPAPTEAEIIEWAAQQISIPGWIPAMDTILVRLEVIPVALLALEEPQREWLAAQLQQELAALGDLDRFEAQLGGKRIRDINKKTGDPSGMAPEDPLIFRQVKVGGDAVEGDKIGRDEINADTYIANLTVITANTAEDFWRQFRKPPPDLQRATARYLAHLVNRYQFLDFRGMGFTDRVALRLPLVEMYVPLRARYEVPKGDTWARQLHLAGRQVSPEEIEGMGERLSERQSLLDLLQEKDGLIVLGDPGSGKTTFLKYLAVRMALGEGELLGLGNRLPVLLPLSAYANALEKNEDTSLNQFFSNYYRSLGVDESLEDMLDQALRQRRTLLLLDGLDEIASQSQRGYVLERVMQFFAFQQQNSNKVVLTSRIVGYRKVRGSITDMQECTLVDFDADEIELFVDKWTGAIERAARGDTDVAVWEAEREREDLLKSVRHNPGVRRLASNPLLLTILALMKRQGIVLPERRVELYEKYVETLLKNWNLARGLGRPPSRDLDIVETMRVLAPLALWMQETSPGKGLVKREAMQRKLVEIYTQRQIEDPQLAAQQLLADARDYASLLLERGPGEYGFIHLTFQEYLAAVGIAQRGQTAIQPVVNKLAQYVGDSNWHEVLLLTIGYLGIIQQRDEPAGNILQKLIAAGPGQPGQAAVFAGEAVVDAWPGGVTASCRTKVIAAVSATVSNRDGVSPQLRVQAAQVLADLGDPRPEITTIDAMPFCLVPRGPFLMGSDDVPSNEDELLQSIYDSQKPLHEIDIPYDYWLARFPVTNAQFQQFSAAGGYSEEAYWAEAREAGIWQEGQVTGWTWSVQKSESEKVTRSSPHDYGRPFNLDNHPVVGLTWYEALAFCRWLTAKWQRSAILPDGWAIHLPSEAEWEKAARGGLQHVTKPLVCPMANDLEQSTYLIENLLPGRLYPWGAEEEVKQRANGRETGIGASSGVGAFASGASSYGCEEMSGNVFEWTRSLWGEWDFDQSDFKSLYTYPYKIGGEREILEKGTAWARVLRGGSWATEETWLRCAYRFRNDPYLWGNVNGFRVCASPFSIPDSDR